MISLADAQRIVVDSCPPIAPVEAAIAESVGLVLAAEVAAAVDVAPCATSAVDGDSWTVALSSDEPASYECSLDGGSYRGCGSTTTFSGLDHGRHSLTARATDGAGNTDPSPAQITTTVNGSG